MSGFNNEQLDNLRKNGWSYHVDNGMTDEQLKQLNKNTEDISQLSSEIDDLYNGKVNAIINTVSGESVLISDSTETRMVNLRVFGKSAQDITTGKNLAKFANDKNVNRNFFSYTTETEKSIVATKTTDGGNFVARYEANLKAGVEYIISAKGGLPIYYYADELWGTMIQAAQAPFSVTPETDGTYVFGAYSEGAIGTSARVSDFMVRESSITSDNYEPYTSGTATPKPEYPQEIRSVGGDGDVNVDVGYGKNLAKFANEENLNRIGYNYTSEKADFIKATKNDTGGLFFARFEVEVKKGVTYTISAKENVIAYVYENELWGSTVSAGMLPHTFTASKDGVYVIGAIDEGNIGNVVTLTNFQAEEGTVATDYKPYGQKQSLSIPTPNGLHGIKVTDATIATYTDANRQMWCADEIDFERGVYVQRTISESRNKANVFISGDKTYFFLIVNEMILKNTLFYCNIATNRTNGKELGTAWFAEDGRLIIGNLDTSGNPKYSTVDELFDHIDKVEFVGILTEPIETPLPAEKIEAFKAIHTNYPSTPILNDSGAYMEVSYVEDTKKYIDKKVSENNYISGEINDIIEPAENDIPKVFINGSIPRDKTDVTAELDYVSKTETFHAYITIKCQGTSSMAYDKKNFTIKMYSDGARETKLKKTFKDWKYAQSKYVLKANYIDHSHARNIISARLWGEVVASRNDYDSLPTEMKTSPNNGAIDGFPIKVYTNGIYQGIYTWNIGKDAWMWNMDEDNTSHVLMCGETNTNDTYAETPCNFRTLWSGVNEQDWSVEVGANSDALKNSLNALITCVKDTDDNTFMETIENHLDLQSAIDYWIHQYVVCGLDGFGKNMLLGTYDLQKWIMGAYDMDSTFGLWWDGSSFVSPEFRCPEDYQEKHNLVFERIAELYSERVKERYVVLRNTVYSFSNLFTHFERFMDVIGKDLYAEDLEVYENIPNGDENNIKQIRNFICDRLAYVDSQILGNE